MTEAVDVGECIIEINCRRHKHGCRSERTLLPILFALDQWAKRHRKLVRPRRKRRG